MNPYTFSYLTSLQVDVYLLAQPAAATKPWTLRSETPRTGQEATLYVQLSLALPLNLFRTTLTGLIKVIPTR